jgi:hypothetical protein
MYVLSTDLHNSDVDRCKSECGQSRQPFVAVSKYNKGNLVCPLLQLKFELRRVTDLKA